MWVVNSVDVSLRLLFVMESSAIDVIQDALSLFDEESNINTNLQQQEQSDNDGSSKKEETALDYWKRKANQYQPTIETVGVLSIYVFVD